jgi:hypothetical protein
MAERARFSFIALKVSGAGKISIHFGCHEEEAKKFSRLFVSALKEKTRTAAIQTITTY